MSRMQRLLLALGMAFALPTLSIAAESPAATLVALSVRTSFLQSASVPAAEAAALSGTWQSEPDETPLSSAFDESVWGKNAVAIRSVQMTVGPTGPPVPRYRPEEHRYTVRSDGVRQAGRAPLSRRTGVHLAD
jgi:hypothetical protein